MRVVFATTNLDVLGEQFAPDSINIPEWDLDVTVDFKYKIAMTKSIEFNNGEWSMELDLDQKFNSFYATPGFVVLKKTDNVFEEVGLMSIGLTKNPVDTSLLTIGEQNELARLSN